MGRQRATLEIRCTYRHGIGPIESCASQLRLKKFSLKGECSGPYELECGSEPARLRLVEWQRGRDHDLIELELIRFGFVQGHHVANVSKVAG